MKFSDKIKKFKNNLFLSDNYQIFIAKKEGIEHKVSQLFLEKLRLKYLVALWFYNLPYVKNLGFWVLDVFLNGLLLYVAITGWFNPINVWHTIFAYGLTIYIPSTLIKKVWKAYSSEKRITQFPQGMRNKI